VLTMPADQSTNTIGGHRVRDSGMREGISGHSLTLWRCVDCEQIATYDTLNSSSNSCPKLTIRQRWEARAIEILRPHLGHTALLQGFHEREITTRSIEPDNVTMSYAGFVVECKTCDISLSQQWNS
jgi:hypothetical protein